MKVKALKFLQKLKKYIFSQILKMNTLPLTLEIKHTIVFSLLLHHPSAKGICQQHSIKNGVCFFSFSHLF